MGIGTYLTFFFFIAHSIRDLHMHARCEINIKYVTTREQNLRAAKKDFSLITTIKIIYQRKFPI